MRQPDVTIDPRRGGYAKRIAAALEAHGGLDNPILVRSLMGDEGDLDVEFHVEADDADEAIAVAIEYRGVTGRTELRYIPMGHGADMRILDLC